MAARWPVLEGEVSETLLREADYLLTVSHEFRVRLKKMMDIREKVSKDFFHSVSVTFLKRESTNKHVYLTLNVTALVLQCSSSE